MDSYVVVGFIVASIIIMFLMKKMYGTENKEAVTLTSHRKKGKDVLIVYKGGPKKISKEALMDMLAQFKRNIVQVMRIVDFDNCYELEMAVRVPAEILHGWINKQTDPSFEKSKEYSAMFQEDDIENEKQQLSKKIISLTDFMYNSKKESEAPTEDSKDANTTGESNSSPIKTKNLLTKLSQDLNMVNTVMVQYNCVIVGTLDIRSFEKLMGKITKNINQIVVKGRKSRERIAPRDGRLMRNNAKIMECYKNECGFDDGFTDSASIILGKNKMANKYFPQIDTHLNKFSTIVR